MAATQLAHVIPLTCKKHLLRSPLTKTNDWQADCFDDLSTNYILLVSNENKLHQIVYLFVQLIQFW